MTENEFLLADRIAKIKSINELYDLENNAYIAFSGGKDSVCLSKLIDIALPDNKIPRVYVNTGIEYLSMVRFVKHLSESDERIVVIKPSQNIKDMLEKKGYPFKSKAHSDNVAIYQHGGMTGWVKVYLGIGDKKKAKQYQCPDKLRYQFSPDFKLKVSRQCCVELKKKPIKQYEKQSGKTIGMTGMRKEEGGSRENLNCVIFDKDKHIKKFHPLLVVTDDFEDWFIRENNLELCELYKPPFNFNRTGCKGCPYSLDLQSQLDLMQIFIPAERKQCEMIWKPVYEEYRRIGYRLRKENQPSLFE